jgi:hypothetical protein
LWLTIKRTFGIGADFIFHNINITYRVKIVKYIFIVSFILLTTTKAFCYPSTGILDDFNRANAGPPLSASWTALYGGWKVVSQQAVVDHMDDTYASEYYNVATYANPEAYITIVNKPTTNSYIFIELYNAAFTQEYYLSVQTLSGTDAITLQYWDGDAGAQLGATVNQEITNGDSVGISVISGTVIAWYKSGAGAWTNVREVADTHVTGPYYITITSVDDGEIFDNFGGGTYVTPGLTPLTESIIRGGLVKGGGTQ